MAKKTEGKKASVDQLNGLHDLITKYYCDQIESGEELSSGFLAAVNSFLKTNNITAEVTQSEPLQDLQKKLQQLMLDEGDE